MAHRPGTASSILVPSPGTSDIGLLVVADDLALAEAMAATRSVAARPYALWQRSQYPLRHVPCQDKRPNAEVSGSYSAVPYYLQRAVNFFPRLWRLCDNASNWRMLGGASMDGGQQIRGAYLASALWQWTNFVFKPAQNLKSLGLYRPNEMGPLPRAQQTPGRGRDLSSRVHEPVLLSDVPPDYHLVEAFDEWAGAYATVVDPFIDPILDEAFALIDELIGPCARILDPSCGPGHAAIDLAYDYPDGEVVCADLSEGMVLQAYDNARKAQCRNMAFFQADVTDPPEAFHGYFDAIFCSLSFHHYPDGPGAARAFHKVLGRGGLCFIIDGGPRWFVELARPISLECDPGFIQHRTGEAFTDLLLDAGFESVYWVEALPGIGITVGSA